MRLLPIICLVTLGAAPATDARSGPGSGGDFYGRIRANDAPIAGRFTIVAYFLDSLDVAVSMPGPGRVLALHFRESSGDNVFVIPGDLALSGRQQTLWTGGFTPLGSRRLSGLLGKGEDRWALWWVPQGSDTLLWETPADLQVHYGLSKSVFIPLPAKDASVTRAAIPWADVALAALDPDRGTGDPVSPDPATFDDPPVVKERSNPEYPRFAKSYDFQGSVLVVAQVGKTGLVEDAYVLHSDALHELKVAALTSVMKWVFRPGRKGGVSAGGEVVIPILFSLGTVK